MIAVGLPLLAADTTRDPLPVALVVAALYLPWAVVAVAGPALTSGADRRTVIGALDTGRTVVFAWLGVQALLGTVDLATIVGAAVLAGAAVALVDDAEQETAAALAGGPTGDDGGRLVAPAVVSDGFLGIPAGAVLFAVIPGAPFLVAAGTYTLAALLALTVLHAPPAPPRGAGAEPSVVARRALSSTVVVGGAVSIGISLAGSIVAGPLVLVGLDELGLDATGIGVLFTAMAAGSLAGGMLAPDLGGRAGSVALVSMLLVGAAGYAAAGILAGSLAAGAALTVASLASMAAMVLSRRHRSADAVAARALHALTWTAIPAGAVAGGLLAGAWGLRAPLLAAAAGLVAVVGLVPVAARPRRDAGVFAKIC